MSYFFVIVPFLLCTVIRQTAPMVRTEDTNPPGLSETSIVQQQTSLLSLNPLNPLEPTSTEELEKLKQDVHEVPCPKECKCDKCTPAQSDTAQPSENPPEKIKTGWGNGLKNLFNYMYGFVWEGAVGKNGFLTLLGAKPRPFKKTNSKNKKGNKKNGQDNGQGGSRVTACCYFNSKRGPPVKDEDDEPEDQKEAETNDHVQPTNCLWLFSRQQQAVTLPGIPNNTVPPVAPVAPGGKSTTRHTVFNCFSGTKIFNIKNFLRIFVSPRFICCAVTVEARLGDKNA